MSELSNTSDQTLKQILEEQKKINQLMLALIELISDEDDHDDEGQLRSYING